MAKAKKSAAKAANRTAKRAAGRRLSKLFFESLKTAEGEMLLSMAYDLFRACLEVYPEQSKVMMEKRQSRAGVFHFGFELRTAESRFEIVIRPGVFEFYRYRCDRSSWQNSGGMVRDHGAEARDRGVG